MSATSFPSRQSKSVRKDTAASLLQSVPDYFMLISIPTASFSELN